MKLPTTTFNAFYNCIDGKCRQSNRIHHGINPSDLGQLWDVPIASRSDFEDAVSSAQKAFPSWSNTKWEERADLLGQAHSILLSQKDKLANILVRENGKPPQFAALEVEHSANWLEYHSRLPPLKTRTVQDDENLQITIRYNPLGIVGAICPWNYPLVLAMGKICASLSTGNCVIVKPSPFTPYSILKFVELVQPIFPPGVIQALNGDDELGPRMCAHPGLQKISFTGSIATGKKIMANASATLKRLTLELGGNSACIVFPDVDIQAVAPQIALGSFMNSGQFCLASKRIYVHEDIYDKFLAAMVETVKSWKVGPALEQNVMLGPVQNEAQYRIVERFFADTRANNYHFALGGEITQGSSFVIQPGIVDNPPDNSDIVTKEPFGPIVPILKWSTEDEVISRVNGTNTGLGGAVWSNDLQRAEAMAKRIEAGSIWINSFEKPLPYAHLAGYKESGLGGEWGEEGLLSYSQAQVIHLYKTPMI